MSALIGIVLLAACEPGPVVDIVLVNREVAGRVGDTLALAVRALDANDVPVEGIPLEAETARGTLVTGGVSTGLDGVATFRWVMDTVAGGQAIAVRVSGGVARAFEVPAAPGPVALGGFSEALIVVDGGDTVPLPIDARDRWGNPIADPALRSSEDPQAAPVVGGRWHANVMGRVRFYYDLPASETLDVYVHPLEGDYRARWTRGDTVWIETGRMGSRGGSTATSCPLPADLVGVVVWWGRGVVRARYVGGVLDTTLALGDQQGVLTHVMAPSLGREANRSMRFRPAGLPATTCTGVLFVYPWRFAILPNFADSLTITPW